MITWVIANPFSMSPAFVRCAAAGPESCGLGAPDVASGRPSGDGAARAGLTNGANSDPRIPALIRLRRAASPRDGPPDEMTSALLR